MGRHFVDLWKCGCYVGHAGRNEPKFAWRVTEIAFPMTLRSLFNLGLFFTVIGLTPSSLSQPTPSPSFTASGPPSPAQSESPLPGYSLAPYEDRLANAQSVKVEISILGLEL